MDLQPRYGISDNHCPVVCKLYVDGFEYESYRKMVEKYEVFPHTKFDESTGELSLRTKDKKLDDQTMKFKIDCMTSDNEAFGRFSDEFSVTFKVPEKCNARLTPPSMSDIKRMWGQAPKTTTLQKFGYKVSSDCESKDLQLYYMMEARPLESMDHFSSLPDEITFDETERKITVCKCHVDCLSNDWHNEECKSIPTISQYELRYTAVLRDASNSVLAKDSSVPFSVTLSPDCSTDTLIFTHYDIQDFMYKPVSNEEKRTPTFSQTVP
jgi:hypothetical protein